MKKQSQAALMCNVVIEERDLKGRLVKRVKAKNLVVLAGRNLLRDLLAGTGTAPTHIAVGTGTAAVADADTALQTQVYSDYITRRVQQSSAVKFQLFIPTTSANGYSLTEAGIQAVLGATTTLFARIIFPAFAKNGSNTLTISWTISIASS